MNSTDVSRWEEALEAIDTAEAMSNHILEPATRNAFSASLKALRAFAIAMRSSLGDGDDTPRASTRSVRAKGPARPN